MERRRCAKGGVGVGEEGGTVVVEMGEVVEGKVVKWGREGMEVVEGVGGGGEVGLGSRGIRDVGVEGG